MDDLNNGQVKYAKSNGRPGGMCCSKREKTAAETAAENSFSAESTCFQTYFYQFNIFLHLGDENALSMMETLKLPNKFFALSKATVDVHQF